MVTHPFLESIGCWLLERRQAELALNRISSRLSGTSWLDLRNRRQRIERDPISGGRVCHWGGSSILTAPRLFPRVGARLLDKCLEEWPIRFAESLPARPPGSRPQISVVLPVGGGPDRVRHFRLALASLFAQVDCRLEIIVVEYGSQPDYEPLIPADCVYRFLPADRHVEGYNKSAAMNAGVRLANADLIVLLDADMVVPERLGAWLIERFAEHADLAAMRFARLIFYPDEIDSRLLTASGPFVVPGRVRIVIQNTPMPLAVRRAAYETIGGHDESFVGWGGEDVEFLSRLRTLKFSEGGRIPIVHVWHPFAPQKANGHRNLDLLNHALSRTAEDRIACLRREGRTYAC